MIPLILHWISWRSGTRHHILLGRDIILGLGERYFLLNETINHLNQKQVCVLAHAVVARNPITAAELWMSSTDLGMTGRLAEDWDNFTRELNGTDVSLQETEKDSLLWSGGDKKCDITVKNIYKAIFSLEEIPVWSGRQIKFWKWHLALKVILFFWLALRNKILTWDSLQRKGWMGPGYCCLCCQRTKDSNHAFIDYFFTRSMWAKCAHALNFNNQWVRTSLIECMNNWLLNMQAPKRIPNIDLLVLMERTQYKLYLKVIHPRPGLSSLRF
jgi:hypothetical protein